MYLLLSGPRSPVATGFFGSLLIRTSRRRKRRRYSSPLLVRNKGFGRAPAGAAVE